MLLLYRSGLSPHTPCRSPGALTRVAACTLARSPSRDRYSKASDISSPPCLLRLFRLERIAGWGLHPLEKRRLVTAHPEADLRTVGDWLHVNPQTTAVGFGGLLQCRHAIEPRLRRLELRGKQQRRLLAVAAGEMHTDRQAIHCPMQRHAHRRRARCVMQRRYGQIFRHALSESLYVAILIEIAELGRRAGRVVDRITS